MRVLAKAIFVALLSTVSVPSAYADPLDAFASSVCSKEFLKKLRSLEPRHFKPTAVSGANSVRYRSPTAHFGTWVEIEKRAGVLSIVEISAIQARVSSWDEANRCAHSEKTNRFPSPKSASNTLSDLDLEKTILKNKRGLLVGISSGMHLSLDAIPAITSAAEKLKLPIIWLCERPFPKVNVPCRESHSIELSMRGVEQHFPYLVSYSEHGLGIPFHGHTTEERYLEWMKREWN